MLMPRAAMRLSTHGGNSCPIRALMRLGLRNVPRPEAVAAFASVALSVFLLALKFVAYFLTGSAAIFSDALESIVNVVASCFALYRSEERRVGKECRSRWS